MQHMSSNQQSSDSEFSRLKWGCRRGMLELDLMLAGFLDRHFNELTQEEINIFNDLLLYPDQTLYEYLMGRMIPTDGALAHVVDRIRCST